MGDMVGPNVAPFMMLCPKSDSGFWSKARAQMANTKHRSAEYLPLKRSWMTVLDSRPTNEHNGQKRKDGVPDKEPISHRSLLP